MAEDQSPEGADEGETTVELAPEQVLDEVWITLEETSLLTMLRRVNSGEDADLVYAEFFANTAVRDLECTCDDDEEYCDEDCPACCSEDSDEEEE